MSDRCVITLPLKTEIWQEDIINKRFEIHRQVYNAMLGYELKKLNSLKRNQEYIEVNNKLYELASSGQKGSTEYKNAGKKRNTLLKDYGLTEFDFVKDALKFSKHFSENIASKVANYSIGKPMWQAFDKMLYGSGEKVSFKYKDSINSVASDGNSAIKIVDEEGVRIGYRVAEQKLFVLYGTRGNKVLKMPIKLNLKNTYELEMLSMDFKQVRVLRRKEKGRYKYYVQICVDGKPAVKYDKDTGELKHPMGNGKVGVYITTTSVTAATNGKIYSYSLSNGVPDYSDRIAELQQYMDNSRRATNPDNYNADGTIKKGIIENGKRLRLRWNFSNRYVKAKNEVAELRRLEKVKRKLHHQKLANEILSLGNDFRVNEYSFAMSAKRSEEDKLKADGTPASKKRGGKNISRNAPAMLIDILTTKVAATEQGIVTKYKLSEEQDFLETRYDGEKWSAFLLDM